MNDPTHWKAVMQAKHENQIAIHELSYGVGLGILKTNPTQEQLDKDFKARKAKGELFTQQIDAN